MTVNLDMLLAPISNENPTGHDLRLDTAIDSLFYQAKDARHEARQTERRLLLNKMLDERADWRKVQKLCVDILQHHSKDIEVATWLIEALLREQGLKGLATGFTLLTQLIERYWDNVYPLDENEDIADRVIAITSLNGEDYDGTLVQPLYHVAITKDMGSGAYLSWQYQQAMENTKYTDPNLIQKKREQGAVFLEDIRAAVAASGAAFYQELLQEMDKATQSFTQLQKVLLVKCNNSAPPSSQIKAALDVLHDHIRFLINEAPFKVETMTNNITANDNATADKPLAASTLSRLDDAKQFTIADDIVNRKQALELLQKIATFFRQTEPQSPLPHLLDRAVRWGSMPFSELLREIIKDEGVRSSAYELMGLDTK